MSNKLTCGELQDGDFFISFPCDGDNSGHGGYKIGHRIFRRIREENGQVLAFNVELEETKTVFGLSTGEEQLVAQRSSHMPLSMPIIKVIL